MNKRKDIKKAMCQNNEKEILKALTRCLEAIEITSTPLKIATL